MNSLYQIKFNKNKPKEVLHIIEKPIKVNSKKTQKLLQETKEKIRKKYIQKIRQIEEENRKLKTLIKNNISSVTIKVDEELENIALPKELNEIYEKVKIYKHKNQKAVYFLVKNQKVIYIGQTVDLGRRISSHRYMKPDFVFYLPFNGNQLGLLEKEKYWIKKLKPINNIKDKV